jgi:hypothetical protein
MQWSRLVHSRIKEYVQKLLEWTLFQHANLSKTNERSSFNNIEKNYEALQTFSLAKWRKFDRISEFNAHLNSASKLMTRNGENFELNFIRPTEVNVDYRSPVWTKNWEWSWNSWSQSRHFQTFGRFFNLSSTYFAEMSLSVYLACCSRLQPRLVQTERGISL